MAKAPNLSVLVKRIARLRQQLVQLEREEKRRVFRLRNAHRFHGFATVAEFISALQALSGASTKKASRRSHRLSAGQRKQMQAAIKAGATPASLAARFKIAPSTAAYHIKQHAKPARAEPSKRSQ